MASQVSFNGTISSTAQGLDDLGYSSAQIGGIRELYITCTGANVRYRMDGTPPTASIGHIFEADKTYDFDFTKTTRPGKLEMIRATSTDASIYVEAVVE